MKFVSFLLKGSPKFGVSDGKNITDLTNKISGSKTLKELISNNGITDAKKYAKENPGSININEIEFLPLIPNPGKIICVGLNYSDHVNEIGITLEKNPVIFLRVPQSQTAHKQIIQKPKVSNHLDYEGEMAVIMSNAGKHIEPKNALNGGIDGYSKIRLIIKKSSTLIKRKGKLILEVGLGQIRETKEILELNGFYINRIAKDLAGISRCIVSTKI